jgi:hypothetical protein
MRAECATFCGLLESIHPPQSHAAFGLSPKFSTPVEKTVEIRGSHASQESAQAESLGFLAIYGRNL